MNLKILLNFHKTFIMVTTSFFKNQPVLQQFFSMFISIHKNNVLGLQDVAYIFTSYLIYIIAYLISGHFEVSCLSTYFFTKRLFLVYIIFTLFHVAFAKTVT